MQRVSQNFSLCFHNCVMKAVPKILGYEISGGNQLISLLTFFFVFLRPTSLNLFDLFCILLNSQIVSISCTFARVILGSPFARRPFCEHTTCSENGCSRTAVAGVAAMFREPSSSCLAWTNVPLSHLNAKSVPYFLVQLP